MNPNNHQEAQWRVTFYEAGEAPYSETIGRFSSAWALTRPYPEHDGLVWQNMARAEAVGRFENGENQICVSWVDLQTRTVLERL